MINFDNPLFFDFQIIGRSESLIYCFHMILQYLSVECATFKSPLLYYNLSDLKNCTEGLVTFNSYTEMEKSTQIIACSRWFKCYRMGRAIEVLWRDRRSGNYCVKSTNCAYDNPVWGRVLLCTFYELSRPVYDSRISSDFIFTRIVTVQCEIFVEDCIR